MARKFVGYSPRVRNFMCAPPSLSPIAQVKGWFTKSWARPWRSSRPGVEPVHLYPMKVILPFTIVYR